MAKVSSISTEASTLPQSLRAGVVGGLVGGVVYGIMMAFMGVLPMVGMIVGVENAVVGFVVHMVASAVFGATFGFVANWLEQGWLLALGGGAAYGVLLWVVGALTLMPLMLGMNDMVLVVGPTQLLSLMGHIIFGMILGAVHWRLNR
jgi:uncharacterized membrane protein YagU involved in acid resistance